MGRACFLDVAMRGELSTQGLLDADRSGFVALILHINFYTSAILLTLDFYYKNSFIDTFVGNSSYITFDIVPFGNY